MLKESLAKQYGINLKAKSGGSLANEINHSFAEDNYLCNRQFCSFCLKT
jgi:hypothetical protein